MAWPVRALGGNRGGLRACGDLDRLMDDVRRTTHPGGSAAAVDLQPERPSGPHPSKRSAIAPFIVMDVMQAAAEREVQGHGVIHMEVGQPGTPAPRAALQRVARALDRDTLGYTVALGLPALRERIARHYAERYGVSVNAERVVVTT